MKFGWHLSKYFIPGGDTQKFNLGFIIIKLFKTELHFHFC